MNRSVPPRAILAFCSLFVPASAAFSQSGSGLVIPPRASTQSPSVANQISPNFEPQNPFLGGVAVGKATPGVLSLPLKDAVDRGLKQNLGALLSSDTVTLARGRRWQMLSALLPQANVETSFNAHQVKLKSAIGLQIPGVPGVIGPFGVSDTRAYVDQSVFNWESIERARSSSEVVKAAQYSYRDARELVVLAVTSSYLVAAADRARVDSAQAQLDTAQALYQQTADQHKAGVAAAIDVLRSQVELQARQQQLIAANNDLAKQKLALARVIGLPAGQQFSLSTEISYRSLTLMSLEEALNRAYSSRPDFRSALAQLRAAELEKKAVAAERYPSLSVAADYGDTGANPASSHGTVDAAAVLKIPVFQGGRVHGDALQAQAALAQARQRLENLRGQLDQDVRDAFLDLEASGKQVAVEKSALDLASQALQQARDRFASGVTDNIEVVQAQDSVASAEEGYIASLYSYNIAKISLARARGIAESDFENFLGEN